jgi:hypothetical protein
LAAWGLGVRVFGPANDGISTRVEEEQRSESSGILKKIRGRFAMARQKVIGSRFGFRYGGQSDPDLIERSLSAPCPTFEPGELTPSNCDKQSGISSSTNTNYVDMWDLIFIRS